MKALYPAVGLQSVNEETSVFIADLNTSKLWQEENMLHQTIHAQSDVDTQLAADTPVSLKIFLYTKCFIWLILPYSATQNMAFLPIVLVHGVEISKHSFKQFSLQSSFTIFSATKYSLAVLPASPLSGTLGTSGI